MKKPTIHLGLEGRFKFVATKLDGSQRVLADWHENLILDAGLERLGTDGVWDRCYVGAGNTAPAAGQTALVSPVASTTNVTAIAGGTNTPTNTYCFARQTYRFAAGVAAGNLSEVGVGWATGLFSRALIKDEEGDPTTITVLSDEFLDVTYEARMYPVMTDQVFTVTINGTPYEFTARPVRFSGNHGSGNLEWPTRLAALLSNGMIAAGGGAGASAMQAYGTDASLAAVTASSINGTQLVSNGSTGNASNFIGSYASGSYERSIRTTFGIAAGSSAFGGFVVISYCGDYQMVVDPPLPKDGTKVLTLDFTVSWGRRP